MERKQEITHDNLLPEKENPLHETVTYKIGGTIYEVSTSCGGSELLYNKMERLIKAETVKTPTDNGFPNPTFFIDDGVSGVTFDRPGWNEMIRLAEAGKVKTVIVKDYCAIIGLNQKDLENQGILA